MAAAETQPSEGDCTFSPIGNDGLLEMCWCEEKCLLGQGNYGRVFKGKWKLNNSKKEKPIDVAVKHPTGPYLIEYDIETLKKSNRHRNILKFYSKVNHFLNRLIVMELCNGTLHDLVVINKDSIKMNSYQLRNIVLRQIVEGVKYLHDNNIFHRDLKPNNILYRIDPLVMKVADFGCSRSVPPEGSTINTHQHSLINSFREIGTIAWLAPEVINGETHSKPPHAVDIFPLGLIFVFTLCGGKHPYGEDIKTSDEQIKNKQSMLEIIPQQMIYEHGNAGCRDLINRMLDPNSEKRPNATEILENEFFPRPITRDSKKEKELLKLCSFKRLEDDNLIHFNQLVNDTEAVDVNCTDAKEGSSTPLILLFLYNQSDSLDRCVESLLQRPDVDVNKTDKYGLNALMNLCQHSKSTKIVEIVKLLIDNGINVNQTNKYGMNALMWLCWHSQSDKMAQMAQLLIENGIDVKKTDANGMNALMHLCHASCSDKIVEVGRILISNGIDVKQSDGDGMTALMFLCAKSESDKIIEMAQLLIANGVDLLKQADKQGRTAVDHMTNRPFYSISEYNKNTLLEILQT